MVNLSPVYFPREAVFVHDNTTVYVHLLFIDAHGNARALCENESGRLLNCPASYIAFKDGPAAFSVVGGEK